MPNSDKIAKRISERHRLASLRRWASENFEKSNVSAEVTFSEFASREIRNKAKPYAMGGLARLIEKHDL